MTRWRRSLRLGVVVAVLMPAAVFAAPLTTTNYQLDPVVDGSFGGLGSTANYRLVDSGGEAAVGLGTSPSYRLGAGYVAELEQSIQLAVLPSGVIAYYPLDTGVGVQAYDSGAADRTGILQNSPTWAAGKIGSGLTFNGSSQYVSTSSQLTNPGPFTIELWFKTNTSSGGRLIGFGDAVTGASTNADRHVYMTDSGNLTFGTSPGGVKKTVTSGATYNDNTWHHLAATVGSGGTQLYVDGVTVGTPDAATTAQNYAGYWRLAYDGLAGWPSAPTSNYFAGSLDEVKIYNRALSSTEIEGEYSAGVAGIVSAQTIPQITAGTSQSALTDIIVRTDAPGYNLAINQDHDLRHTDTTTIISPIAGSVAAPDPWTESTTTGLGFSLTGGAQIEGKWGTSPNFEYAALPSLATVFHSRAGSLGGSPESNEIQFRLDVPSSQKAGQYSNTVTITATLVP